MEKQSTPIVSEKSKKIEILGAYKRLLSQLENKKSVPAQEKKRQKEEEELVSHAAKFSCEGIVRDLANIKLMINKKMDEINECLIDEHKKFAQLHKTVEIKKEEVEELYGIVVSANSLEALIEAQKERKEKYEREIEEEERALEKEIASRKSIWEEEQKQFDKKRKEEKEESNKEHLREEEEYSYSLQLERKKEQNEYLEREQKLEQELQKKREQVEKELREQEEKLLHREEKLDDLTAQVDAFPTKLGEAMESTRIKVEEETQKKYQFEIELSKKEKEGEKSLYKQQIESLESKIEEQKRQIDQLRGRVNESNQQVQAIAIKAVEGASQTRNCYREDVLDKA